jgi:hypothetical protein
VIGRCLPSPNQRFGVLVRCDAVGCHNELQRMFRTPQEQQFYLRSINGPAVAPWRCDAHQLAVANMATDTQILDWLSANAREIVLVGGAGETMKDGNLRAVVTRLMKGAR